MKHKMVNFCEIKNWYLSFTFSTIRSMAFINSKKIENNKLVLVKEIRKSYYDSIIDQKKVFSEIEENSKCKIIQ
jgi:hypothetical protein